MLKEEVSGYRYRGHRISLVIPIGRFSFFVDACLRNVFETYGATEKVDFVFLTARTLESGIETRFREAALHYCFRVIRTPFEPGPNHLRLLDWAMRHADLTDWVIVQHCDLFWREHGWLERILEMTDDQATVFCNPCSSGFRIQVRGLFMRPISLLGDFFGVYRRHELIRRGLFFQCGTLDRTVKVTEKLQRAIQAGWVRRESDGMPVELGKEYIDGSQAISWELALGDPRAVKQVCPPLDFVHLWQFFRISEIIWRQGHCLGVKARYLMLRSLPYYSFLTSFCIERKEVEAVVLPWRLLERVAYLYGWDISEARKTGKWLQTYSVARDVIGTDDLGIEQLNLNGQFFSTRLVKFA